MSAEILPELLHQRWLHAHEEDTETRMVYRPAHHPLPRSRGRGGFELRPGGELDEIAIGPTDRRESRPGRWKLEGGASLAFYRQESREPDRVLRIASLEKDRLVVER